MPSKESACGRFSNHKKEVLLEFLQILLLRIAGIDLSAQLLHLTVQLKTDVGTVLELCGDGLWIFDVFFVLHLMLQACPTVHGNGAELNLYGHELFLIGEKDGNLYDQVETAVAVFLWRFDVVFFFQ